MSTTVIETSKEPKDNGKVAQERRISASFVGA
jgi:hypothetical protein